MLLPKRLPTVTLMVPVVIIISLNFIENVQAD